MKYNNEELDQNRIVLVKVGASSRILFLILFKFIFNAMFSAIAKELSPEKL